MRILETFRTMVKGDSWKEHFGSTFQGKHFTEKFPDHIIGDRLQRADSVMVLEWITLKEACRDNIPEMIEEKRAYRETTFQKIT